MTYQKRMITRFWTRKKTAKTSRLAVKLERSCLQLCA